MHRTARRVRRHVRASTRVTHTDPKAEYGAWAVALAAWMVSRQGAVAAHQYADKLRQTLAGEPADELLDLVGQAVASHERNESTQTFADALGLGKGVSGYIYHAVPVALHAWLSHQTDFRSAVQSVIQCGGDTDSTAAMVGGVVGCAVGIEGIPGEWLDRLWEWPRSVGWMKRLAGALHEARTANTALQPPRLRAWAVLPRNLLFLSVVLAHGFRRLLPPY